MFIRQERKDWNKGIPSYGIKDLMGKEEIYDFGLDIVYNDALKNGFIPINGNKNVNGIPSLIFKKDNKIYFVIVEACIAPKHKKLDVVRKYNFLNHCKKEGAIPLYASVSFGSTDETRFNMEIALKGDSYYCDYDGLEEVKLDLDDKLSLEYNIYLLNKIGQSFEDKDYDSFLDLMMEDCSIVLDNHDGNLVDLTYVFNDFLDAYKSKKVVTSIVKALNNEVFVPYLFVGYEDHYGKNSCEFSVLSNELGYIKQIKIEFIDQDKIIFD